jgi:sigma-E factor negative regulatory protein RseB
LNRFLACLLCLVFVGPVQSQEPNPKPGVEQWLARLQEAAGQRTYTGTFVVTAADRLSSARIWHVSEGAQQMERVDALSGVPRSVFRRNDEVLTLLPQTRMGISEKRQSLGQFPDWLSRADASIAQYYALRPVGLERVAGWEADVARLMPKDAWRFGYRVWTERTSGLVLKLQTLGLDQTVLEQAAFSDLQLASSISMGKLSAMMNEVQGYRIKKSELVTTTADQEGWDWKATVPGFKLVSCHKREIGQGAVNSPAMQCVCSDGLASVSVFIEPFDASRHGRPMSHDAFSMGATRMQMQRIGDWWLTAVGEVPQPALQQLALGFERKK